MREQAIKIYHPYAGVSFTFANSVIQMYNIKKV